MKSELDVSGVYQIRNKVNGKIYVGSSGNIKKRWSYHCSFLRRNKHKNPHLQAAWNKYGEEAFEILVLEVTELNKEALERAEQKYIDATKCCTQEIGYNIASVAKCAMFGLKHSEETKRKMSEIGKGRVVSEEAREKIRKKALGRKVSEETRKKISKANSGKKLSKQHRENLSKAARKNIVEHIQKERFVALLPMGSTEALKILAKRCNITVQNLVREAIMEYLKTNILREHELF